MLKIYAIIFLVFALLHAEAQDYNISFAGSGATTAIGTVKVDNLTSGATVTLNGSDILHLVPSTGIGGTSAGNKDLHLFPNPMEEKSTLVFETSESGTTTISLVDLSGQTVCQITKNLSPGEHTFYVSGIRQGMYLVKVKGNDFYYSGKLISRCNLPGAANIEFISSVTRSENRHLESSGATVDMPYTDGNILMYKGISGEYSAVVTDVPTGNKTMTFPFVACTDNDGNHYATIRIGTGKTGSQTWMAENLAVGTSINVNQQQTDNGIIEKYCYNDYDYNCSIYGGLYQFNEMMQYTDSLVVKGICPDGWHIPTIDEWAYLLDYVGGREVAGGKLKETGNSWLSPNVGATNECGFSAIPGGWFDSVFANAFSDIGRLTYFWTSLSKSGFFIDYYYVELSYNWYFASILKDPPVSDAYSVRCVAN